MSSLFESKYFLDTQVSIRGLLIEILYGFRLLSNQYKSNTQQVSVSFYLTFAFFLSSLFILSFWFYSGWCGNIVLERCNAIIYFQVHLVLIKIAIHECCALIPILFIREEKSKMNCLNSRVWDSDDHSIFNVFMMKYMVYVVRSFMTLWRAFFYLIYNQ